MLGAAKILFVIAAKADSYREGGMLRDGMLGMDAKKFKMSFFYEFQFNFNFKKAFFSYFCCIKDSTQHTAGSQ